jgi:hypothetical protein
LALTLTVAGCATAPPSETADPSAGANEKTTRALIAIGAALAVGAVLAKQAGNNVEDAVRDAARQ